MRRFSPSARPAILVGLVLLYLATGKLGLRLAFLHPSATPVWAPTGLALAATVLLGAWVWPAILAGAFLVNISTAGTAATSLGIAIGNTLEAVLGGYLVVRYARGAAAFERPRDTLLYIVLAGAVSTSVSATCGVTSLALGHAARWSAFAPIWLTWWLGDAGGDLLLAPAILLWAARPRLEWSRARLAEALTLLAALVLAGTLVFGSLPAVHAGDGRLWFATIPFLMWAAFRFEPRETATACLALAAVAVTGVLAGRAPLPPGGLNETLLLLQAFLETTGIMALLLAAATAERRQVLVTLGRHARELERSNASLEQFAYAASHDLKEPLRMVTTYTQLLSERYGARLDREAREFIGFAVEGAAHMQELITGLLDYSRASVRRGPLVPVDMEGSLAAALDNLRIAIQESGAVVTHDPLLPVRGDPLQITLLLQNLIGNAVKFRGPEIPRVHVGCRRREKDVLYSVQDNGIGIAPEHLDRIFGIFRRLHTRDRFPGSGVGLAICRKIVEQHGGQISVTSEPGRGSTFSFWVPEREDGTR